jgi:hypothetical protein
MRYTPTALAYNIAELGALADDADDIAEDIARTVALIRAAGGTWTAIGDELGVTRQAAQQRYGRS